MARLTPSTRMSNPYAEVVWATDWKELIKKHVHDVRPPDDNRPFFFYMLRLRDWAALNARHARTSLRHGAI